MLHEFSNGQVADPQAHQNGGRLLSRRQTLLAGAGLLTAAAAPPTASAAAAHPSAASAAPGPALLTAVRQAGSRAADFDGDGRAEILVTSPWGIGILEQAGSTLGNPVIAANGTRFGGWLLNTADNEFGS